MNIDYEALVPVALQALYPTAQERQDIEKQLSAYGIASFHQEIPRVWLGILYLASKAPENLAGFIALACADYRDLLCAAEYPYTSRYWQLEKQNPKKYRKLQTREESEYIAWVESIRKA